MTHQDRVNKKLKELRIRTEKYAFGKMVENGLLPKVEDIDFDSVIEFKTPEDAQKMMKILSGVK